MSAPLPKSFKIVCSADGKPAAGLPILLTLRMLRKNPHTAVVGPFEVISHLGSLYKVFRRIAEHIETEPPTAAILIDFPDFNLRLAGRLKRAGIRVAYYVSPQVWAWRPRIRHPFR